MSIHKRSNTSTTRLRSICCALLTILIAGCGGQTITAISLIRVNIGDGDRAAYETYKQTQAQLVKSPFVLRAALRTPEIAQLATITDHPKPVEWLEKHIKTKYPGDSEILRVSLQCMDADDATAIVDAVVSAYLEEVAQAERNHKAERLDILRASYRKQTEELKDAHATVERLASEIGSSGSARAVMNQQIVMDNIKARKSEISKLKYDLIKSQTELYVQTARKQIERSPTPATPESEAELLEATSRHTVLTAAAKSCREECEKEIQTLQNLTSFSAELEVRKLEISILVERVKTVSNQIYDLEMEVSQKPRIQLVQQANTKKDDGLF